MSRLEQEITGPTDSVKIELTWDGGKGPFAEWRLSLVRISTNLVDVQSRLHPYRVRGLPLRREARP
jgi:hypothetical protein